MGDIKPKMTEQEIMNIFHEFNIKPQSIKLIKDKITNENKNFCFLSFKTIKEANAALFKLNGKKLPGYPGVFRLNWANCHSDFNYSAYVGNLNPKIDDIKLYNLFKKRYPTVQHASVVTKNGISKGYGFVLFNGKEEYEKSLKEMNGIHFYGKIIKVKEQRQKLNKDIKNNNTISDDEDNNDSSSSLNDSETNSKGNFIKNIYSNIININNINNYSKNSDPLKIINNEMSFNTQFNNIIINNNNKNINTYDLLSNNEINEKIGINNIKNNIPYYNINENLMINENINDDIRGKLLKKSNISNNSIISLNSVNSDQISNYSTAEQFNKQKKQKKDEYEILLSLDEKTLNKKIHEMLKNMYNSYKTNPFYENKTIKCK
jgi:RNA recognition motif-containing protein